MIYNVPLLILYFILSEPVKTQVFGLLPNLRVWLGAYEAIGIFRVFSSGHSGQGWRIFNGKTHNLNVPQEHVTVVPLSAVALLNSSRLYHRFHRKHSA